MNHRITRNIVGRLFVLGLLAGLITSCASGPTARIVHSQVHGTVEEASLDQALRRTTDDLSLFVMSLAQTPRVAVMETLVLPEKAGETPPDWASLGETLAGRMALALNGESARAERVDYSSLIADPDAYHKVPDHLKGKVLASSALHERYTHLLVSNLRKQDDGLVLYLVLLRSEDGEPLFEKAFRIEEDLSLWMAQGKTLVLASLPAPFRVCSLDTPKTRSANMKRANEQASLLVEMIPDNGSNKVCLRLPALDTPAAVKQKMIPKVEEKPKANSRKRKASKRGRRGKKKAPQPVPVFIDYSPVAEKDALVCFQVHASDSGSMEDPYPPSFLLRNGIASQDGQLKQGDGATLSYVLDAWGNAPLDVELQSEYPFTHTGSLTPRKLYAFITLNGKDLRTGRYLSPAQGGWWVVETHAETGLRLSYYGQNESPDTHLRFENLENSFTEKMFNHSRYGVLSIALFAEADKGCPKGLECPRRDKELPCRLQKEKDKPPVMNLRKAEATDSVGQLPDDAVPLGLISIRYDAPSEAEKLRREEEARRKAEENK